MFFILYTNLQYKIYKYHNYQRINFREIYDIGDYNK